MTEEKVLLEIVENSIVFNEEDMKLASITDSNLLITTQNLADTSNGELYLSVPNGFFKNDLQTTELITEALSSEHFLSDHNYHHVLGPDNKMEGDVYLRPSHVCSFCNKTFHTTGSLTRHLRSHTGERPYRCEVCEKSFTQQSNLWKHIRIHTGEKPFRCPQCEKQFTQRANMQKHMMIHSGERPYICKSCNRAFTQRANLVKHMRIHRGDKPYACKYCDKAFAQRSNMRKHEHLHEDIKPYTCSICFVSFTQQSNLKRHQQIHNNVKPHVCVMCDKRYVQKTSLDRHMETCAGKVFVQLQTLLDDHDEDNVELHAQNLEAEEQETYYVNDVNELIKVEYDE